MPSRITPILAGLALILAVGGVLPSVSIVADSRLLWTLVPVMSAASVLWLIGRRSLSAVWVAAGVSLGFVVLGAWSVGLFFAPSAVLLLAAAGVHTVSVRAGWRAILVPAWLLIGATGLCALFFAYHQIVAWRQDAQLTQAPAIVAGTALFFGLAAAFVVVTGVCWLARRRRREV
jgi:hypothetical protein